MQHAEDASITTDRRKANVPQFNEGRALLIWPWNCKNKEILTSKSAASVFLFSLAEIIDMTPIDGPHPIKFHPPSNRPQDAGISVTLTIEESHLAIHTFPEQADGAAQITIVSCCDFNQNLARKWILKTLETEQCKCRSVGGPKFFEFPETGG